MLRRKSRNICSYWDCNNSLPADDFLCAGHYEKWVEGLIDRCPRCGRFKDIMYYLCLDCYAGRRVKPKKVPAVVPKPKKQYRVEYSEAWTDGYMMPDKCFIYIIGFDDGPLYVGQTTDIRRRLSELREPKASPAGRNPRLEYLEMTADEKAAELRLAELKKLVASNPGQIGAMVSEFHNHMREFGFEED